MGDKGIKAIAVRGTKDVYIAKSADFMAHMKDLAEFVKHRNANPLPEKNIMAIHTGVGSPQAMKHVDEKWHTEGFAWGRPLSSGLKSHSG